MPDSLPDTAAWSGDEQLTPVMTRRSTVDWVLQRAAAAEPRVTVRFGVHVVPFYHDQAVIDAARLAMMRHTIFGTPLPPSAETYGRVTYSQLRVAASWDPAAFRAFWKINGMVCPPGEVYTDPDVVARTRETLRRHGAAPPVAQPTREQLLTALTR
jgi:hypothetical protein